MVDAKGPLIVALDFSSAREALDLASLLDPETYHPFLVDH